MYNNLRIKYKDICIKLKQYDLKSKNLCIKIFLAE
nr:MAG TPA: hypothetical protein [Caudoviricetes sp.]